MCQKFTTFGMRNHAGVIFWELKNVFKEPLIKYFSKKLQNEATHAILETVSGSAKMALLPMICYNFEIFLQNFIMAC